MSTFIPTFPETPFINPPAPAVIPRPTPHPPGTLARRPRHLVYINGHRMRFPISISITRGLDQEVATCDLTFAYPLPSFLPTWSRVAVLLGVWDPDVPAPWRELIVRFAGYFVGESAGLWPGTRTMHCADPLVIAKYTYTPEPMDNSGETDDSAIRRVLGPPEASNVGGCGIGVNAQNIRGLGESLGDVSEAHLYWEIDQTALEYIQSIDAISLGYRTYGAASGILLRRLIDINPNTVGQVWWFNEGVDILDGSMEKEILDPKNEITVTGFGDTSHAGPDDEDPFYWRLNTYWIRYLQLKAAISGGMVNPTTVAEWIQSQINRPLIKVTFSTHLPIPFQTQEVIGLTSPILECNQKFWVQSVNVTLDPTGQFTQTLTCISELGPYQRRTIMPPVEPPPNVVPGAPVQQYVSRPTITASASDLQVDFTIEALDREFASPAIDSTNRGQPIFGVLASDQSTSRQGRIVSRVWAAAGPGVVLTEGGDDTFTTYFTDITSVTTITLTVTDNNGSTASVTRPVNSFGTPVLARKLYSVTPGSYEAYDGNEWRTQAPVASDHAQVVGGGPYWGAGAYVATSEDDLATPAVEVQAIASGSDISAIWVHEEDENYVAVGAEDGSMAYTTDGAATWTAVAGPGGTVQFVIVSIFNKAQWHVVTAAGWFKSENSGQGWELVRAGSFVYLELSHTRNIVVTTDGVLQKAEDGTPFTGNTAPIVAATAHIRKDIFYAIADDGTTWYCGDGDFTLVPGEPIPAGTPYHAGTYRDGLMVDLVYFAAQDGGLFKTMDGFRTADGYLRLRSVGMLTP